MSKKSRIVLITGGTDGIGFTIMQKYLHNQDQVIITGRTLEKVDHIKEQFAHNPNFLHAECVDVGDKLSMETFLANMLNQFAIDIVIANAGISVDVHDIANDDLQSIAHNTINTNLLGTFNTVHPLISHFIQQRNGKIVLISSLAAFFATSRSMFYSASKVALKQYGELLTKKLKPYNVQVNIIFPGFIESKLTKRHNNKIISMLMLSNQKGVDKIFNAIESNNNYYAFPWYYSYLVRLISILPYKIRSKLLF